MKLQSQVDHLVVAAASLEEGVAWCRDTLGFEPTGGGAHPLMSTHNRVFNIGSPEFPGTFFEIIAIDPAAPPPGRTRWFELDEPAMQALVARGPRLIHFAARTDDVQACVDALAARAIDRGPALPAQRGDLRWKITVRDDGQRLFGGTLPTLLQWDGAHPCDTLPPSGITLKSLAVSHPQADPLRSAYECIGLVQVDVEAGEPDIQAVLATPRGNVTLSLR